VAVAAIVLTLIDVTCSFAAAATGDRRQRSGKRFVEKRWREVGLGDEHDVSVAGGNERGALVVDDTAARQRIDGVQLQLLKLPVDVWRQRQPLDHRMRDAALEKVDRRLVVETKDVAAPRQTAELICRGQRLARRGRRIAPARTAPNHRRGDSYEKVR